MGAGCSSPLRRLGGKKSKLSTQRGSGSVENHDNPDQLTIAALGTQDLNSDAATLDAQRPAKQTKLNLENEITIQSETADDHPSSASYYTDGRNQDEDNKLSNVQLPQNESKLKAQNSGKFPGNEATARMMGLASFAQYDRHLLVSPALSPAPSTCQSPALNTSFIGGSTALNLFDLFESFKTLTFGSPDNQLNNQKIKQPERLQSELQSIYSQQLIQNIEDMSNFITVVFITTENDLFVTDQGNKISSSTIVESIFNQLTTHLKSICGEHSFHLRSLNLSHDHLSNILFVNNMQEVAMNIFKQEYEDNEERFIVIILANGITSVSHSHSSDASLATSECNSPHLDANLKQNRKRLLPTHIDACTMSTLLNLDSTKFDIKSKELLKLWYNQVGNVYHLKPIYLVDPDILSESKENSSKAWQRWTQDANAIINSFESAYENEPELLTKLSLNSLSNLFIDYLLKETQLQKRTLLVRNYPQSSSMMACQPALYSSSALSLNKGTLSELARQLPDPNKLTIKRTLSESEFMKIIDDWISEHFIKYVECFLEYRIVQGKFPPPFIERNLFVELSRQRHQLEFYLNHITGVFESKCQEFYSNQIRPLLMEFIDGSSSNSDLTVMTTNRSTTSGISGSKQSLTTQSSANHLVLISGPKGCGKTTLFAQLVKQAAQDLFNKALIIYRICGSTLDSLNPDRLLRSICEQFCQIYGENTTAASYVYSSRQEIMNSLNKIIKQQNCLMFLDGIDSIQNNLATSFDWLCDLEASGHIKIFITLETGSKFYEHALGSYADALHVSLDNPSISEWAQLLTQIAKSRCLSSVAHLYDDVKDLGSSDPDSASSMTYRDICDTLSMCSIRRLNNEFTYPELQVKESRSSITTYKNIIKQSVLKHLHYLLAPHLLCSFFITIDSSRNGLTEHDITEIMKIVISQLAQKYPDLRQSKFSSSTLSYLKVQLKPWLKFIVCDKLVKLSLQKDFLAKALDFYLSNKYPKLINEVREILMDYFNRPFKQIKQKGSSKSPDTLSKDYVSHAEAIWLDTQVSETMNLLILTNPNKAREHIMSKDHFYLQFLHRTNPEEFLEDYERLKLTCGRKSSQTNEDLSILVNFIKQSVFPLRYSGSQIYSQIYCRSYEMTKSSSIKSKGKKLGEIISQASSPPLKNLLPISDASIDAFIKTRIGLNAPPTTTISSMSITSNQSSDMGQQKVTVSQTTQQRQNLGPSNQNQQQQGRQKIFTINDNHRHMIVIYPDKNSLSVWDIFEERAIRTITNVDQPRDLRMIDQKKAVVLCNRELRVYDLDSGQLLTKLKGVMNQKMPYFEVFGKNYVIALARNRMYVNMLNLNTGELETTFKVGEDRFLNSLLVSAHGGICVCGDETQKPFPLLVWNLNERRLMYDLRLDRHEFITRMSAISDDGHFVVSVCRQLGNGNVDSASSASSNSTPPAPSSSGAKNSPNFIVIYDLNSGTLFKKWKPGLDTCAVAISLSSNRSGKVINTIVDNSILVWDLSTGSKRHTLIGHSSPADVIIVQNNRLFSMDSSCRDQSLRIWDIEDGYCLAVFSPDAPVSSCQLSIRGDTLVCGFASETRLSSLVVCKNESANDIVKKNKRRKSSKSSYIFDDSTCSRKASS